MRYITLLAGTMLIAAPASAASLWQECQIETVTLCSQEGCKYVEPTLKIYLGDYTAADGRPKGYYYRCRRDGPCDMIENPWIGYNDDYRVFVVREGGVIARVRSDGRITDVSTLNEDVLISRGSCWAAEAQPKFSAGQ